MRLSATLVQDGNARLLSDAWQVLWAFDAGIVGDATVLDSRRSCDGVGSPLFAFRVDGEFADNLNTRER